MGKLVDEFMKIMGSGSGEGIVKTPQKKAITLMASIVAIGIILMFLNSMFSTKETPKLTETPQVNTSKADSSNADGLSALESSMAENLVNDLSQIAGVGDVTARVNLATSAEHVYAFNDNKSNEKVEEKDTKGGSRITTKVTQNGQLVLIKESQDNRENPVVIKEIKPEIQGVIVIAEGARNDEIKAEITEAVETLYDLPAHKVTVLPMESR